MKVAQNGTYCNTGHLGGFSAQMNAQAVMLTMAISDNVGVAIAYDMQMRKHIANLARQRRTDIDFAQLLSKENEEIKKQVIAQRSPKTLATDKDPKKKGKGKGKGKPPFAFKKPWEKRQPQGRGNEYDRSDNRGFDNRYGPRERSDDYDKRNEGSAHDRKDSPKRSPKKQYEAQRKKDKK